MNIGINFLTQMANSATTIACGLILLLLIYQKKLEKHPFYYAWSAGFILYGIQICLRYFTTITIFQIPMFFAFIAFIPFSIWILRPQRTLILLVTISLLAIIFAFFLAFDVFKMNVASWLVATILFYGPIGIVVCIHRKVFGNCMDKFVIGWFTLFLVNLLFPFGGWIADTLAIFAKILLLVGIQSYDFAIVSQKIKSGLVLKYSSPLAGYKEDGGFKIALLKARELPSTNMIVQWLKHYVNENSKQSVDTSILVMQDILPYQALRSIVWSNPKLVHVFLFSENPYGQQEFTSLKFGLTEIGATITEIAKKGFQAQYKHQIVLVDLSVIIHSFGAAETYHLLLNKMGTLRSNGTSMITTLNPQTHNERVVSLFKMLADDIIQI